ncbi:MAG: UbiX family flavin prenyltransferase [Clostridiales bacterium]|nr:UbiX family flavin prenyltransferase [Clostridiales bacterium]
MGRYTVAITGASGSVYGLRAVERLLEQGHEVTFLMTEAGREVTAYETGFELPAEDAGTALARFLELPSAALLRVASCEDLFDPIASGSYRVDGMLVIPASMGFCAAIASGIASNLAERAADVMLKERRPLVLVPRETPFSLVHLRNLTVLTEAGAIVAPASPGFYHRPETLDDQVNFVVGKVFDVLGIEHKLFDRWGG